ncbi:MAG: GAF domain-containing protein [Planctomycetes bacterium]|nr:GAF domain-containing protein [Planctomycetota bacterium]
MEGSEFAVERLKRLELLHTVSRELHNSLEAEALLPRVLALVLDAVGAEAGSIWLLRGDKIVCAHAAGGAGEGIVGLELPRGAGVVGSVAESRKPEVVLDAAADRRHIQQVDEATGFVTKSMMTVPLVLRGECLGSLQILNKKDAGGRFTREDADFLREIALDAAAVIRNAQLLRTERRAKEMRALLRMSREITSTLDLDRILTTASNVLTGIVAFERCAVSLDRRGSLQVAALSGKEKVDRAAPEVKALEDLLGWLRGFEKTLYSPDPAALEEEDPQKAARFRAHAASSGMKAVLAVPLRDDSGFIGMLSMESAKEDFLEEGQLEVVETFANQVAVAMRNADLYRQTPLVGILGKRSVGGGGGLAGGAGRLGPKAKAGIAAGAAALLLLLWPFQRYATGEAEVIPAVRHHLRADAPLVVDSILVDGGQAVRKGEELGRLRTRELEVELAELSARARGHRAEAMRLEAAGRVAEERAARDLARHAEAQIRLTEERIEAAVLRAPADGFVLTHRPRDLVGTTAEPGKTLIEIAEEGRWTVEIRVPQADVPGLAADLPASFASPAVPGVIFEGRVASIGVTAVDAGGTPGFPVVCTVEDRDGSLRSGMKGRGHVRTGRRSLGLRFAAGLWRWVRWQTGL